MMTTCLPVAERKSLETQIQASMFKLVWIYHWLHDTFKTTDHGAVLADPWFWSRAYNGIQSVASESTIVDLAALDFYFYNEWYGCKSANPGAYYLDLRTSKDISRMETWKNSLTLQNPVPKAPVIFLLEGIDHWPRLVVFNYEKAMVLVLGQSDNVQEFHSHQDWRRWNGQQLWTEISATMGWIYDEQNQRVIDANWIAVSCYPDILEYCSDVKMLAWVRFWPSISFLFPIPCVRRLGMER
jgi:hypothetical protein